MVVLFRKKVTAVVRNTSFHKGNEGASDGNSRQFFHN